MPAPPLTAYATVASVTPTLTVTLDLDTDPIPARDYGLSPSEGDRVLLQFTPPIAPLIIQVFT